MSYKVKLEVFEGPLDLLLYLIKKEEIDIYDIPIAKITEQYLEYLDLMRLLDLNIAGEFLVMAATLMHIKSRMLLPPDEQPLDEEEMLDPRAELVRKLLEYKKFKEAAGQLQNLEVKRKELFIRQPTNEGGNQPEYVEYFEATLFDLISAFSGVLKEVPKQTFYQIVKEEVSVEEKIHYIFHQLVTTPVLYFVNLFKDVKSKLEIIATFLAVLELIRLREILVVQKELFAPIEIIRNQEKIAPKQPQREQTGNV